MAFCDPIFVFCFLPLVLLLHFAAPHRLRNALLAVASFVFYAVGDAAFAPWLVGSVLLNYVLAQAIERTRGQRLSHSLLAVGVLSDLGLLFVFKYLNFCLDNLNALRGALHLAPLANAPIALPLGLSFFTFHKISYKVDVWRGTCRAKRSILDLFLYILLFPQLIAGPIVRYHEIADALQTRRVRLDDLVAGSQRFVVGLAKKVVVANPLAGAVDTLWGAAPLYPGRGLHQWDTFSAWTAAVGYSLQIYFDFAGYSDMAIGLARMFGFRFPENFNWPYRAQSITDFWRRWHMSLSRFFRDYVYIPLGGNRRGLARTLINLCTIFVLCGLWHGAQWTFFWWGAWHGGLLMAERALQSRAGARALGRVLPRPLLQLYAFAAVTMGWLLFRAESLAQAWQVFVALFGKGADPRTCPSAWPLYSAEVVLALVAGAAAFLPWDGLLIRFAHPPLRRFPRLAASLQGAGCLALLLYVAAALAGHGYSPFIYYRF